MHDPWLREALETLCRIDTTSGHEDRGLEPLLEVLREMGADVTLGAVERGRTNVLATWGRPRVLFTTHLDTVPPFIAPRWEGDVLWGRGACDAKGQAIAQLGAVRALLAEGQPDVAWMGVVGEETDSLGAQAALGWADRLGECRVVVDGEPTELVLAAGQRGVTHLRLSCRGVAAHSGTPERGRSAAWMLIDWLERLRARPAGRDAQLGPELWNLGTMRAGEAANVVPATAQADLLLRTIPGSTLVEDVRRLAPPEGVVEALLQEAPDLFPDVPGFPRAAVPFGSDAPRLRALVPSRAVVLCGPGSITVAHGVDERLALDDLARGVDLDRRVALHFLAT